MKPIYKIHNLTRAAHNKHTPRHQFLASLRPKDRAEAAKVYDELDCLAKLPSLPADREILHHKLTVNTRQVCMVSSRDTDPDDLMLLAGLLRGGGGTFSTKNVAGENNLPDSGVLIDLEIKRPEKNRASFKFGCEGFALTFSSWAADSAATANAWEWLEKLWIGVGDVYPEFIDPVSNLPMPEPPTSPWTSTIIMPPLWSHPLIIVEYISRLTSAMGTLLTLNNSL